MRLVFILVLMGLCGLEMGCRTASTSPAGTPTSDGAISAAPQRRSLALDGVTLSILEAGQGDPVISVHGVVTTSHIFPRYLAAYSPAYRGIAVDLRG